MEQNTNKRRKILSILYVVLLFSICVALLVFIFPKNPKFDYEFTKGSPWLYNDLIADFDFPIYKSDDVIKAEEDSINEYFIHYYSIDTAINKKIIIYFKNQLKPVKQDVIAKLKNSNKNIFQRNRPEILWNDLENIIINELNYLYDAGIISIDENISTDVFYITYNETIELRNFSDFYTGQKALEQLKKAVQKSIIYRNDSLLTINSLEDLLSLNNIIPNIIYNHELSNEILKNRLNSISATMGMVQVGELIILRGSIVNENTYNILASLQRIYETGHSSINIYYVIAGISALLILLFLSIVLYLKFYFKKQLYAYKTATYIVVQILFILLSVFVIINYTGLSVNIIPFTLIALLILTFYNFHIAFFIYLSTILMIGFFVPNNFEFLFIQLIAGLMALFSMRNIQKRRQIFVSLGIVILTYSLLHTGFVFIKHSNLSALNIYDYSYYAISSFLLLLFLPFVYIYEKIFGFVSDFSLMELSDTNNPVLRELAERAPGTFQHTLQVANLTESVVRELGGNALLARTGALYHDIGKIKNPDIFIENQSADSNIHKKYSYEESAENIIEHVKFGVKLSKKHNLPKQISDFISMHHGTGITKYFYNSWINENPGKRINKSKFTYPGPKPQSVETAIMMMADSVEAASRTLKTYNEKNITNLVNEIIDTQLDGNQFDDVDITLKQITMAKRIFIEKLKNIYHSRIEYPKLEKLSKK